MRATPSRPRSMRIILALTAVICLPALLWAQSGRLVGQVTDARTGTRLPGANIAVQGTTLGATTNAEGNYTVFRVPAGAQTVRVSYIGFKTATRQIQVEAGQSVQADFALEVEPLAAQEAVVLGSRAMTQALALAQQQSAANIKNVIAADQMGQFPDASAPDALQRVPGIHVVRDMGEGRYVQIRGAAPAMTAVTFNGESIPSPEGDVRQIALDAVPTELLEAMEVAKAITPRMDADAIGGAVNLVTRRAPAERLLSVEATSGYGWLREDLSGKAAFTWGDRLLDDQLGLLVSASNSKRLFGADDLEPAWDFGDEAGSADDALEELQVRHYTLSRQRRGLTGIADYRLSGNTTLFLNGTWTEMQDHEQRRRLIHAVEDGELAYQHKDREEALRSWNFTAGGEHLLAGDRRLDYHLTATLSEEDTPFDNEIAFVQEEVSFSPDLSDGERPRPNPQAGAYAGPFAFDSFEPASSLTRNRDYVAALNLSLPLGLGRATGAFEAGAKYRFKNKTQDLTEGEYGIEGDLVLGQGFGKAFVLGDYQPGDYAFPAAVPSKGELRDFMKDHDGELEANLEADAEDYEADEKTLALYAQAELNLSPSAMLLLGARVERTSLEATGYAWDSETEKLSATQGEGDYTKPFPMAHLRYRLGDDTNLRAALTTALMRPNFFDLAPYRIRDDEDLALGNPGLSPAYSYNADLMLEHYMRPLGMVSVGFFHKRIQDPIFVFTAENELGGDTVQPRNGEKAWLSGFEAAYQQQLGFLPAPLKGLGLYANYTYTTSEATLGEGRLTDLAGQARHVGNAALSYEKGPFSGQLSLNYHDRFISEFGEELGEGSGRTFTDVYVKAHRQLDLSASYRLARSLSVSLELLNLTDEPWQLYQTHPDRPIQREFYQSWGWLGFNLNL